MDCSPSAGLLWTTEKEMSDRAILIELCGQKIAIYYFHKEFVTNFDKWQLNYE